MTTRLRDWLEISTEGFAQRQADRKPEHLLKELVQNALDAVTDSPDREVTITVEPNKLGRKKATLVTVTDNGPGISDASDLRTVFCTSKTDSFMLRGRLGQGFKECLCLALEAQIDSRTTNLRFHIEKGVRVTDISEVRAGAYPGTKVKMWMDWPESTHPGIIKYLHSLIPPENTSMRINGQHVPKRKWEYEIEAQLRTELFQDGRWVRRERTGAVQLITPALPDEAPMIYEMGIPVQEIDWTQPYHVNVLMRVPMNPRRDAVAAGYLKDLYRQVLPILMPKMEQQELRDEWVSQAIEDAEPEMRKEVVTAAFGTDAVRSVPTLGRYDFDSDAREIGYKPIDTRLLPRGLREATQEVMKTSRDVELERRQSVNLVFSLSPATDEFGPLKAFVAWLAEQLVGIPVDVRVADNLVINDGQEAVATWVGGGRMSLNKLYQHEWANPLSERFLGLLVHETAHEKAGHHGDDFRREVERMAGKLALFCLNNPEEIRRRWPTT